MKYVFATALAVCLSAPAWAGEVKLKNGGVLKGLVREECGRVVVETESGTLIVPVDEVGSVVQDPVGLDEYQERVAELGRNPQAPAVFDLALWAKEHQLGPYVNTLLYWTLALDPDHPQARKMLNYVRYEGRWISGQERVLAQERAATPQRRSETPVKRARPAAEVSPGYVYFGIPPSIPPRGSENHGGYGNDSTFAYPYPMSRGYVIR